MGLSETIIAAIIGAGATMATAIFQLIRNRAPSDVRPRKKRLRSLFATVALMIGCIVGGYAWSSLRTVSATEQMRSTLQTEFTRQFAALAVHQATHTRSGSAESLLQLPPCRAATPADEDSVATCTENDVQTVALCAALPAAAQRNQMQVMARVQRPDSSWQKGDAGSGALGDLHVEEAQTAPPGAPEPSACVNVANWSVEDMLMVRLVVDFTLAAAPTQPAAASITAALQ